MSDMIINDSVPVDKKWNELIKYNIFVMKLVEFVISMVLMILPFQVNEADMMHCLAAAPTLVMSLMFAMLYLVDQMQNLAEQLYIIFQLFFNIVALVLSMYQTGPGSAVYGLFYVHLIIALCIDQFYIYKERGFSFK